VGVVLNPILDLRGRKVLAGTAATFVLGLMSASGAFADDSPSLPVYGGTGGSEQGTVDNGVPPSQAVLGVRQAGGTAPDTTPGGNEVLGARTSPKKAAAPAAVTAPAAATAPVTAHATHRLVGNLPFTGLDIGLLAAAGLGLAGLGFGLRRLTAHSPQAS
jgi:hypothetical protein